MGHRYRATVAQVTEPGRRLGHRYRSQCGTEVPNFHMRLRIIARPIRGLRRKGDE
jgi:hypothetical protein